MVTKNRHVESSPRPLTRLAGLYNVQTRYRDALGRERVSPDDSVILTLLALGAEVNRESGLMSAIRSRELELWSRMIDPVVVAWGGVLPDLTLRISSRHGSRQATVGLTLHMEEGSVVRWSLPLDGLPAMSERDVARRSVVARRIPAGQTDRATRGGAGMLPPGYHRLHVEFAGMVSEALVISAPRRCWERQTRRGGDRGRGRLQEPAGFLSTCEPLSPQIIGDPLDHALRALNGKEWGIFAPVYALRSERDWGAGDLADLGTLMRWTEERGGSLVATLPLLSASIEEVADPSPYRPFSRLFWNEFYLAPELTCEWGRCPPARELWSSPESRRLRERLRAKDLVDYHAVMTLKRPPLEASARCFFERADKASREDFEDYLDHNPVVRDYAAFRAGRETGHRREVGPEDTGDAREAAERYHLYCQWQMDRQLASLSGDGRAGLMLDLPLGVHPDGFDVKRWPGLFARGVSTGAPPDAFFAQGQDWTTPPLHPEADRLGGYRYFRNCLRTHMRHAAVLRIDHMMSFHRLFWIPEGRGPAAGTYVSYPAEELYAVLSCESHRNKTEVVGEDLGTVAAGVRASMNRHAVARTFVFLGSLRARAKTMVPPVPSGALVTLGTHDMVPLAGFLEGDDITTRVETRQLDVDAARREYAERRRLVARLAGLFQASATDHTQAAGSIFAGILGCMARSAAKFVLVSLDDLLLERRPQNVPGTGDERANWRHKIAIPVEKLPGSRR
jgi:4-alpha-glucanotransferase